MKELNREQFALTPVECLYWIKRAQKFYKDEEDDGEFDDFVLKILDEYTKNVIKDVAWARTPFSTQGFGKITTFQT